MKIQRSFIKYDDLLLLYTIKTSFWRVEINRGCLPNGLASGQQRSFLLFLELSKYLCAYTQSQISG